MLKYGTQETVLEEDGLCKVASEPMKSCCVKKLAQVRLLSGSGIEFNCDCGNKLALENA